MSNNSLPKIETFEHDIASKVNNDSSPVTAILASEIEDSNSYQNHKKSFFMPVLITIVFVTISVSLAYVFLYNKPKTANEPRVPQNQMTDGERFADLYPTMNMYIGKHIKNMQTVGRSQVITFGNWNAVFAYITKNEDALLAEWIKPLGLSLSDLSKSEPGAPEIQETLSVPQVIWEDITLNGTNMRTAKGDRGQITYSFVDENTLIIATTPEILLTIKSARMRQ